MVFSVFSEILSIFEEILILLRIMNRDILLVGSLAFDILFLFHRIFESPFPSKTEVFEVLMPVMSLLKNKNTAEDVPGISLGGLEGMEFHPPFFLHLARIFLKKSIAQNSNRSVFVLSEAKEYSRLTRIRFLIRFINNLLFGSQTHTNRMNRNDSSIFFQRKSYLLSNLLSFPLELRVLSENILKNFDDTTNQRLFCSTPDKLHRFFLRKIFSFVLSNRIF